VLTNVLSTIKEEFCTFEEAYGNAGNGNNDDYDDDIPLNMRPSSIRSADGTLFAIEHIKYMKLMSEMKKEARFAMDPLVWWSSKKTETLPIHRRVASKILPVQVANGDQESMFSVGRRVASFYRSSLLPSTINKLVSMNRWMEEEDREKNGSSSSKQGVELAVQMDAKGGCRLVASEKISNNNNISSSGSKRDEDDCEENENEDDDEMEEKLASERQLEAARQRIAMEQELQEKNEEMLRQMKEKKEKSREEGKRVSARLPKLKEKLNL